MIHFSDRIFIVNEYEKWLHDDESRDFKIADDPLSFVSFLESLGLLNESKFIEYKERKIHEEVANAVAEGIPLDNVIPDYACGTCKYASIHCTLHDNEVASSDGCGDWEDD